jgi:hypothetical protein
VQPGNERRGRIVPLDVNTARLGEEHAGHICVPGSTGVAGHGIGLIDSRDRSQIRPVGFQFHVSVFPEEASVEELQAPAYSKDRVMERSLGEPDHGRPSPDLEAVGQFECNVPEPQGIALAAPAERMTAVCPQRHAK